MSERDWPERLRTGLFGVMILLEAGDSGPPVRGKWQAHTVRATFGIVAHYRLVDRLACLVMIAGQTQAASLLAGNFQGKAAVSPKARDHALQPDGYDCQRQDGHREKARDCEHDVHERRTFAPRWREVKSKGAFSSTCSMALHPAAFNFWKTPA